jgi:hypothetical protein
MADERVRVEPAIEASPAVRRALDKRASAGLEHQRVAVAGGAGIEGRGVPGYARGDAPP